jgi:hypothetical protein
MYLRFLLGVRLWVRRLLLLLHLRLLLLLLRPRLFLLQPMRRQTAVVPLLAPRLNLWVREVSIASLPRLHRVRLLRRIRRHKSMRRKRGEGRSMRHKRRVNPTTSCKRGVSPNMNSKPAVLSRKAMRRMVHMERRRS